MNDYRGSDHQRGLPVDERRRTDGRAVERTVSDESDRAQTTQMSMRLDIAIVRMDMQHEKPLYQVKEDECPDDDGKHEPRAPALLTGDQERLRQAGQKTPPPKALRHQNPSADASISFDRAAKYPPTSVEHIANSPRHSANIDDRVTCPPRRASESYNAWRKMDLSMSDGLPTTGEADILHILLGNGLNLRRG